MSGPATDRLPYGRLSAPVARARRLSLDDYSLDELKQLARRETTPKLLSLLDDIGHTPPAVRWAFTLYSVAIGLVLAERLDAAERKLQRGQEGGAG